MPSVWLGLSSQPTRRYAGRGMNYQHAAGMGISGLACRPCSEHEHIWLDVSKQKQDDNDDHDQADAAHGVIAPSTAVGPCRQRAKQDDQQYDDEKQGHGLISMAVDGHRYSTSWELHGQTARTRVIGTNETGDAYVILAFWFIKPTPEGFFTNSRRRAGA